MRSNAQRPEYARYGRNRPFAAALTNFIIYSARANLLSYLLGGNTSKSSMKYALVVSGDSP